MLSTSLPPRLIRGKTYLRPFYKWEVTTPRVASRYFISTDSQTAKIYNVTRFNYNISWHSFTICNDVFFFSHTAYTSMVFFSHASVSLVMNPYRILCYIAFWRTSATVKIAEMLVLGGASEIFRVEFSFHVSPASSWATSSFLVRKYKVMNKRGLHHHVLSLSLYFWRPVEGKDWRTFSLILIISLVYAFYHWKDVLTEDKTANRKFSDRIFLFYASQKESLGTWKHLAMYRFQPSLTLRNENVSNLWYLRQTGKVCPLLLRAQCWALLCIKQQYGKEGERKRERDREIERERERESRVEFEVDTRGPLVLRLYRKTIDIADERSALYSRNPRAVWHRATPPIPRRAWYDLPNVTWPKLQSTECRGTISIFELKFRPPDRLAVSYSFIVVCFFFFFFVERDGERIDKPFCG